MNYVDPTGEIAHVAAMTAAGAAAGAVFGLGEELLSQAFSGEKFDLKKALGSAAEGAVTGAAKGLLASTGAGLLASLGVNLGAGAVGSGLEQWISTGEADPKKSVQAGVGNAVASAINGNKGLDSVWDALVKGAETGGALSGLDYLFRLGEEGPTAPLLLKEKLEGLPGSRDPRIGCYAGNPLEAGILRNGTGYEYETGRSGGFSLKEFVQETLSGAVAGGVGGALFYELDAVRKAMKESIWGKKGGSRECF